MDEEIKRIFSDEGLISEDEYSFTIKPIFSTQCSIIGITPGRSWHISCVQDDTLGDLLGLKPTVIHLEYNLTEYPVDNSSIDNIFSETNIAQGKIIRGKRSGDFHNLGIDVNLEFKTFENCRGGVQWYMMQSKSFLPKIGFILKNGNGNLVSFNGQSKTF